MCESWRLIFQGLLLEVSTKNFIVPIPKTATKLRIFSSIGINSESYNWKLQELTIAKRNYTLVESENFLNFFSEDNNYYYFKTTHNTAVNDNYAYIYAK